MRAANILKIHSDLKNADIKADRVEWQDITVNGS